MSVTLGMIDAIRRRLSELERKAQQAVADLAAHLGDTIDAHDASAISYAGATGIAATDVEAAIDEVADERSVFLTGSYTPTLTNMAVGTGGGALNTATYVFIGGPDVGDAGLISIGGRITFGTTGATLPGASAERIRLPSGFNFSPATVELLVAQAYYFDTGSDVYRGEGTIADVDDFELAVSVASGATYVRKAALTSTVPHPWAVGDEIYWTLHAGVVRV